MKYLGTDIALDENGDILVKNGDISIISDIDCLQANLLDRLLSVKGDLILHPDWGADLEKYVSQPLSARLKSILLAEVKFQILDDPRVKEILALDVEEMDRGLKITAKVITQGGQVIGNLVFPFEVI